MANDNNTRQLIQRMLDKGSLLPETVEELKDYLEEIDEKGSLDRMDTDYVQGLSQRLALGGKGSGSGAGSTGSPPAAANDSDAGDDSDASATSATSANASIARARDLVGMLYEPATGLNQDVSDERASEILDELLQSLDDAESAISHG